MTDAPDDRDILLNAYFDGELDAVAARRFEAQIAAEPHLAADLARLRQLRGRLRADLADDVPPAELRRRITRRFASAPWLRPQGWQALAASLVIGVAIGSAATVGTLRGTATPDSFSEEVVAAHIRALMAPSPADVASSDHHTVKPWFAGKVAFAPQVVELAASGYPLVGGRVDVVGFSPVPALVYRAGKHLISLIEMPAGGRAGPSRTVERGYETISWADNGVRYYAVSDASDAELQSFVKALRAAIGSS